MAKMQVLHPNSCGIDVGSKFYRAAIGLEDEQVKEFCVYAKDHQKTIVWLKRQQYPLEVVKPTKSYM